MVADAAPVDRTVTTAPATPGLSTIGDALAAIAAGRPVIVADDESRENEGDVVLAAELASPEWIAWTVAHSSGFICAPVSAEIADRLDLPPMVSHNEDVRGTAYTVTVDAAIGVTTGISAHDRARTLRVLADPGSVRDDLHRPGHVVPLRARPGGVRERPGHTEASIDLVTAAGLRPAAAICEIVDDDGEMMRLPRLLELGAHESVPVITIAALAVWLDERDVAAARPAATTEEPTATAVPTTGTEGEQA